MPFLPTRSERDPMGVARKVRVIKKAEERKPISRPVVAPSSWAYSGRKGIMIPKPSTTMQAEKERARTGRIKIFDTLTAHENQYSSDNHAAEQDQGSREQIGRQETEKRRKEDRNAIGHQGNAEDCQDHGENAGVA
jgi:hypothetical protein